MKRILAFIAALCFGITAHAQGLILVRSVTGGTVSNYLAGRYVIDTLEFENSNTTNTATVKLYDWATAATNIVRAAYTSKLSYATNYSVAYTNSAGIVATNTFVGTYIANVINSAVTNEQTRLREYLVPAATLSELTDPPQVARGLTLLSTTDGTVRIYYRAAQ